LRTVGADNEFISSSEKSFFDVIDLSSMSNDYFTVAWSIFNFNSKYRSRWSSNTLNEGVDL
jgi:hypothetical protein